jgi:hypothetical protein
MEKGISDGTNGYSSVTREQMATMLYRYAGSPETRESMSGFKDADKVSSYARDAMNWAVEVGIITGTDNNELNPTGTAARAQVATMLQRYVDYIVK